MSSPYPPNGKQVEVEVDQPALVNILARCPGQFDVLRELIQNADDAVSAIIELRFETKSQHAGEIGDISQVKVRKWIIKNKGSFKQDDWDRLGKIASGNKDSTKVGTFGVGFYSVMSKSDRPLVKSGGKSLQFYRARDGRLCKEDGPGQVDDGWTWIELELKEDEALPVLDDLARFLVSSVALLANIHTVSVHLDGERLLQVAKKSSNRSDVIPIPKHLINISREKALRVDSVQRTVQTITIDRAEWAFTHSTLSSPPNDAGDVLIAGGTQDDPSYTPATPAIRPENELTHDLYTAAISVILDQDSDIRKGVESILKSLPLSFMCKGVYFNSEQHKSFARMSKSPSSKAHLFKGIVPENNNGRLFIGQSTNQTTGIGLHFSAHYLPTMERGAIDLANGQIASWNREVLWVSGFLARVIYEEDMRFAKSKKKQATKLALETMARFSFGQTAPHNGVSAILQDAFFSCALKPKSPLPVVSDTGICSASDPQFRQTNNGLFFLKMYRALHQDIQPRQYSEIIKRYEIPLFRYIDIVNEFATGVTHETMMSFFAWWQGTKRSAFSPDANEKTKTAALGFCNKFTSRGVLRSSKGVDIPLKLIKHFTSFPIDGDLSHPMSIYIDFSSGVPTRDAVECFGWTQLSLPDWLKHVSSEARHLARNGDLDVDRRLSRVIIQFALGSDLTQAQWDEVSGLMRDIKCIPTNKGLRLPAESYFEVADICQQLPVAKVTDFLDIQGTYVVGRGYRPLTPDHVTKTLTNLGVRTVMEWADLVLINLLQKSLIASEESNDRFLHFLYGKELTDSQTNDLKMKKVFSSQDHGLQATAQLHLPNDDIRKLGLPVLELPQNGKIHPVLYSLDPAISSPMEWFLGSLGIQSYPSLNAVIHSAASDDPQIHQTALDYFLKHFEKHYEDYNAEDFAHVAFIPTKCGSRAHLHEVFTSSGWGKLKFKQASEKLRPRDVSKLGIKERPPVDTIIKYLQIPHQTLPNREIAKLWFEHLFSRGNISSVERRERLSTISFVPVETPGPPSSEISTTEYSYYPPKQCFTGSPSSKKHHRDIFPFVDFGQEANNFLESCCAKKSPDATDIAYKMAEDPQKYLKALEDDTGLYIDDLRTIASQFDSIPEDTKDVIRKAPMFLGFRQHMDTSKLLPASRVVIGDWESRDFGDHVFLAPEEDAIKEMYHKMGSQFLGAYVRYNIKSSGSQDRCVPSLTREQIIRGVSCFISRKHQSRTTKVSFNDEDVMNNFVIKVCKSLRMTKTFTPRSGVLADNVEVPIIKDCLIGAGFDPCESTLWLVEGPSKLPHLVKDVAIALCSVLLNTFSADDVLLLASLIVMDEERFRSMYPNEKKIALPSAPAPQKAKPIRNFEMGFQLFAPFAHVAMRLAALPGKLSDLQVTAAEDDMHYAVEMFSGHPGGRPYDFSKFCQPYRSAFKKGNSYCKEAYKIKLMEDENPNRHLRFFWAHDARCRELPGVALEEFSKLIIKLAGVFQLPATTACYVFWADTNDDLMAFNRDQKFLFFNLFYYHTHPRVEQKKVVTDWFLIMAHEIAHNGSQDHDEYHGWLTSRLVLTYFAALQKQFPWFAEDNN